MNHVEVVLLIVLWCWSSLALGAPQVPGVPKEATYLREVKRLSCDKEGRIQQRLPALETPSESGQAESLPIIKSPDMRSVLVTDGFSSSRVAVLVRCNGGQTTTMELHYGDYLDPSLDTAKMHPSLDQMGSYQFTPDGSRLVFVITVHSVRVTPNQPPPYQSTLLVGKFIVVEVASARTTTIDVTGWGYNSYSLSNDYIVFRGTDATFRADFEGRLARLTPLKGRDLWTPELSPDGKWVAEILVDQSYVLTNVRDPTRHIRLFEGSEPWKTWTFNAFSPDSKLLAYGIYRDQPQRHSRDHSIRVVAIPEGEQREVLSVRDAYTILMKVSPDNSELLVYSHWVKPVRSARLYCVSLNEPRVSVAPHQFGSGNLYVDDRWTVAEVSRSRGKGNRVPIDCASWKSVDRTVGPPANR